MDLGVVLVLEVDLAILGADVTVVAVAWGVDPAVLVLGVDLADLAVQI